MANTITLEQWVDLATQDQIIKLTIEQPAIMNLPSYLSAEVRNLAMGEKISDKLKAVLLVVEYAESPSQQEGGTGG